MQRIMTDFALVSRTLPTMISFFGGVHTPLSIVTVLVLIVLSQKRLQQAFVYVISRTLHVRSYIDSVIVL